MKLTEAVLDSFCSDWREILKTIRDFGVIWHIHSNTSILWAQKMLCENECNQWLYSVSVYLIMRITDDNEIQLEKAWVSNCDVVIYMKSSAIMLF